MKPFIEDEYFQDIDMPPYLPHVLQRAPGLPLKFSTLGNGVLPQAYNTPLPIVSPVRRLFNQLKECLACEDTANTPYIVALLPIFSRGKVSSLNEAYDFILRDIRWSNGQPSRKLRKWRAGLMEWIEQVDLVYAPSLQPPGSPKTDTGVYVPLTLDLTLAKRSKTIAISTEMEDILLRERPLSVGERDPLEPVRLHMFLGMLRAVGEAYSRQIGYIPRQSLVDCIPVLLAGCMPKLVVVDGRFYLTTPQSPSNILYCLRPSAISKLMKLIVKGRGPAGPWFSGEAVLIQLSVKHEAEAEDDTRSILGSGSSHSSQSSHSSTSSRWSNDTQPSSPEASPRMSKLPLNSPSKPTLTFQAQLPTSTYPKNSPSPDISCKPENAMNVTCVAALLSTLPSPSLYAQPTKRPLPPNLGPGWRWWVCDHPLLLPADSTGAKSAAVADVLADITTGRVVGVVRWL